MGLCLPLQRQTEKMMKMKTGKKENGLMHVAVKSIRNGYILEVEDEGYLYLNTQQLLEGFIIHVGLKRLEILSREDMERILKATTDGSAEKLLQEEITALKMQIVELKRTIKEITLNIKD